MVVSLLELSELEEIIAQSDLENLEMPIKEKAAFVSSRLQRCAAEKGVELKLKKRKGGA